jgi:putative redox protein
LRATARRLDGSIRQSVSVRVHELTADEPVDQGGTDAGPCPEELLAASLASCSAITMEMYARRKGWNVGEVEVEVDYEPAHRGAPTHFGMVVRFPAHVAQEQRERLLQVAAKCPVHRTLEGEVMFEEKIETF